MFASIKQLTILAVFFGLAASAPAAPALSPDVMSAFGLGDTGSSLAQNITADSPLLMARVASCQPPSTPHDASYGACILPLSENARTGNDIIMLALAEYLTKTMGCSADRIQGGAARPVTQIRAFGCGGPGPQTVDGALADWSINSSFNEAPCLPGNKCA